MNLRDFCRLEEKLNGDHELRVKTGYPIREVGRHLYTSNSTVNEKPNHVRSLAPTGPNNKNDEIIRKSDRPY